MPDYKTMYFQLAAKVADALDILLKAQQEGEAEFMNEESFPGLIERNCWMSHTSIRPLKSASAARSRAVRTRLKIVMITGRQPAWIFILHF